MPTILIANPHKPIAEHFVSTLEPEGYTFAVCLEADAVKAELARGKPDLVIADVDLPGLDAFELAQLLYDRERDTTVPLIVVHSGLSGGTESPVTEATGFTWMGVSAGPDALRSVVQAKLSAGETPAASWRVLVVDDDPNIRNALATRLEMEGYTVQTAQDGQEALEMMSQRPDAVLMDVDMPRLNGFAALERIRAEPETREIPVIIMTAAARSAEQVEQGLGLGANDYLRKPFEMLELVARVKTQLRLREAHRLSLEKHRDLAVIELAGAAAHEINNPLAVLSARLELMLADGDPSEPDRKHMEQMQALVYRIAEVVRKLGQVQRYQVQAYCGDVNIVDLDGASLSDDDTGTKGAEPI